jgi:hypothetical protein
MRARIPSALILLAGVVALAGAALAQSPMKLFKVVTAKDEILIGLSDEDLRKLGPAPDLDNLAQHLASTKQMTPWQYAVGRDAEGNLQHAPLRRVAIFANESLRIEPYSSAYKVAPPKE